MSKLKTHAVCDYFEKSCEHLVKIKGQKRGRYTIQELLPAHIIEIDDVDFYDEDKKYSLVFNMDLFVKIGTKKVSVYANSVHLCPIGDKFYSNYPMKSEVFGSLEDVYAIFLQEYMNFFDILSKSKYVAFHRIMRKNNILKFNFDIGEITSHLPNEKLTAYSTAYVPLWNKSLEIAYFEDINNDK